MNRVGPIMAAFTGVAAIFCPGSAAAQIAPGESGHSTMQYFGGQEVWDTLSEFGECYASHQRTEALQFVSTKPDSLDEVAAYKRLFSNQNQSCLSLASELRVPYQMVRGAIAEGLYRRAIPVPASLVVGTAPRAAQVRNFMDAALCYAAGHREQARTLLSTTHLGSKGEDKAVTAMLPDFGACIPPGARSISISNSMIRVRLAEAMWRLGETASGRTTR